jgi:uncharacterized Zn-binding protein involved in type VI secretion
MAEVARMADSYDCGDTQRDASGTVFVNNLGVARLGDFTVGHCFASVPIIESSSTVFADSKGVARLGDAHAGIAGGHTCGLSSHDGDLDSGSANVFADGL